MNLAAFDFRESAEFLKKCQVLEEHDIKGTVCPWELNAGEPPREDLHDTLEALYIWTREENKDFCKTNIDLALDYVTRKFDWYKKETEPIKSYDSTFYLLALHNYLTYEEDRHLLEIENYARSYLIRYFEDNPPHNLREYSNPYWKAAVLALILRRENESTKLLEDWLEQEPTLPHPENEENHMGRGYMYPHDFFSTFGTKLMAINLILPNKVLTNLNKLIPKGFVSRDLDEVSFNSSIMFGLCTLNLKLYKNLDFISETTKKISNEIENRLISGGVKRGKYFPLRESWPTFFFYFSKTLCEGKELFNTAGRKDQY